MDGRQLLVGEILRRAAQSVPDAPAAATEDAELSYAELDRYAVRHPSNWRLLAEFLGGEDNIRAYQFDFRDAKAGIGRGGMRLHHDSVQAHRFEREPYHPLDAMCTIHYLTDVTAETPAFVSQPRPLGAPPHLTLCIVGAGSRATIVSCEVARGHGA